MVLFQRISNAFQTNIKPNNSTPNRTVPDAVPNENNGIKNHTNEEYKNIPQDNKEVEKHGGFGGNYVEVFFIASAANLCIQNNCTGVGWRQLAMLTTNGAAFSIRHSILLASSVVKLDSMTLPFPSCNVII